MSPSTMRMLKTAQKRSSLMSYVIVCMMLVVIILNVVFIVWMGKAETVHDVREENPVGEHADEVDDELYYVYSGEYVSKIGTYSELMKRKPSGLGYVEKGLHWNLRMAKDDEVVKSTRGVIKEGPAALIRKGGGNGGNGMLEKQITSLVIPIPTLVTDLDKLLDLKQKINVMSYNMKGSSTRVFGNATVRHKMMKMIFDMDVYYSKEYSVSLFVEGFEYVVKEDLHGLDFFLCVECGTWDPTDGSISAEPVVASELKKDFDGTMDDWKSIASAHGNDACQISFNAKRWRMISTLGGGPNKVRHNMDPLPYNTLLNATFDKRGDWKKWGRIYNMAYFVEEGVEDVSGVLVIAVHMPHSRACNQIPPQDWDWDSFYDYARAITNDAAEILKNPSLKNLENIKVIMGGDFNELQLNDQLKYKNSGNFKFAPFQYAFMENYGGVGNSTCCLDLAFNSPVVADHILSTGLSANQSVVPGPNSNADLTKKDRHDMLQTMYEIVKLGPKVHTKIGRVAYFEKYVEALQTGYIDGYPVQTYPDMLDLLVPKYKDGIWEPEGRNNEHKSVHSTVMF